MPFTDVDIDYEDSQVLSNFFMFVMIFILFILSWISVAVVGRAIDNFTFSTLKLDSRSTYHTTVIAIVVIVIEIVMIYYFKSMGIDLYDRNIVDCNRNHNSKPGSKSSTDGILDSIANIHNIEII